MNFSAWGIRRPLPVVLIFVFLTGLGLWGFSTPGTFVFAMIFLVAFVLYYFVNWKYLSAVWGMS